MRGEYKLCRSAENFGRSKNEINRELFIRMLNVDVRYANYLSYSIFPISPIQVSTTTGIISHFVNLQVVVPEAFILGSGELHVDMGSTINLVCIIEKVILFGCALHK